MTHLRWFYANREESGLRIAVYAFTGITMFHLSVPQMVFDEVARQGLGRWQTVLFSDDAEPIRTAEGYQIDGMSGPEATGEAEVVVVPSWHEDGRAPPLRRCACCLQMPMIAALLLPGSAWEPSRLQMLGYLPVVAQSPVGRPSTFW